ncbi:hemolysin family protein [Fluviispira sanaruensis]|uniref:HlyC/CorC family transporter n=1 Tax=Fluviispira sanaruensis TaxID=2493639 RepID=A0A4V0P246_FLUSA|nr:hemolysin family protein [Fluviispira sanaruensis]BBH51957.1 HlyC/CorC family transporter [Fluviispira sanaruensis]
MESLLIGLLIVFISLSLSAFFSMTETAATSISNLKAKHMYESGQKSSQILKLWLNTPNRVLAALLIGNNLANIFASVFVDDIIRKHFGSSSIFVVTAVMTIIIVLFAEIIPKTFAKANAVKIVVPALKVFKIFYLILLPVTLLMTFVSNYIGSLFSRKNKLSNDPQITEEELEFLINVGEKEGVIAEQKHDMLSGIFELGDTVVREIMVHRIDLTAVSQSMKIVDVIDKFKETGLSRIPVYEDKIDNIIGTIHAKDALFFLKKHQHESSRLDANVSEIRREVMFIPETKAVDHLFQEMKRHKQHMAIVLDEYGGTSGIVTMEDIFEEIFGEVRDEFDNEEDAIRPTQVANQFLVECKIHIDDFCDFFDIKVADLIKGNDNQEFDTLAGLILHHFGQIPKSGDKLTINNVIMEVVEVSKRRVRRVVVRLSNA